MGLGLVIGWPPASVVFGKDQTTTVYGFSLSNATAAKTNVYGPSMITCNAVTMT